MDCGEELLPCNVPRTGRAPIVFTRVQMFEVRRRMTHGVANRLLFDVGVKRIQQDADRRIADRLAQLRRIGDRVEEIRFEPVQRLERDVDTRGMDRRRKALPAVHRPFPFLGRATMTGQIADGRVHRPGKNCRAGVSGRGNARFEVRARLSTSAGIRGCQARAARNNRHRSALEPEPVELASNGRRFERGWIQDGHFDAIEPMLLDFGQQWKSARPNVAPQMKVFTPNFIWLPVQRPRPVRAHRPGVQALPVAWRSAPSSAPSEIRASQAP